MANVKVFWKKLRSPANAELTTKFRKLVQFLNEQQEVEVVYYGITDQIERLGLSEGLEFTFEDYRRAVAEGIGALPDTADNDAERYRGMVLDGRCFEVVDGVVFGG